MTGTILGVNTRTPAVIVVNYDSADLIRRNLAVLVDEFPDLVTVVVDNYSTAAAVEQIECLADSHGWTLVKSPINVGFGGGMNLGIAAAAELGSDTFLMLNPDACLGPESFVILVEALSSDPMSLISPVITRRNGSIWFEGGALDLDRGRTISRPVDPSSELELPWLSGACLMTGAEAWGVLGGFDEDYFLYWEDVDLSVRAQRRGIRLAVVPEASAVHDEGGTQEQNSNADFSWDYYYYNIRNRLLFASKLLDSQHRKRWIRTALRESYRILLRGGGKRKFLRPLAPLVCGARGLKDGLASRGGPRDQLSDETTSS
ncbi:MAG: glycosyltransferase family 2 protein [Microthrixaceae bacterium]